MKKKVLHREMDKLRKKRAKIDKNRSRSPSPEREKAEGRPWMIHAIGKVQEELHGIRFQMQGPEAKKAWGKIKKAAQDMAIKKIEKKRKITALRRKVDNLKNSLRRDAKRLGGDVYATGRYGYEYTRDPNHGKGGVKKNVRFAPSVAALKSSCVIPKPKPMWSDYIDSATPPIPHLKEPKKYTSRVIMKRTRKGQKRVYEKRCPSSDPYLKRKSGHYCCAKKPASKKDVCDFAAAIKENIGAFTISREEYEKLSKKYRKKYDSYVGRHAKGINWYMTYYCNS